MRLLLMLWGICALALGACVTDGATASPPGSASAGADTRTAQPAATAPSGQNALERPVGGPHTAGVMAMDWPPGMAPLEPVKHRMANLSEGADWLFQRQLLALPVADEWGHSINPALLLALAGSNTAATRAAALDFARDRMVDDTLSTQFELTYARLLAETPGLQDSATVEIIASDLTATIDSARCLPGLGDRYAGLLNRRRDFAPLYAMAREVLAQSDDQKRIAMAKTALLVERRTAPIRKDVVLCRYGALYTDFSSAREAECAPGVIGTCYKVGDNKAVPTRWADEEKWHQERIKVLRMMTPEKIVETYSHPLPQVM